MTTLLEPFLRQVERAPQQVAIIGADDRVITYGELDARARALAAAYEAAGIGPGDRVLVALSMTPALYVVLIALWRLGAVAVFPEPAAGLSGLGHAARLTQPRAYVGPWWLEPLCRWSPGLTPIGRRLPHEGEGRPAPEQACSTVTADHPALVTFTSGSTGLPKGIVRSHGFLGAQLAALRPLLEGGAGGRDMVSLPMFVLVNLGLGITSVIPDGPLRRPAAMDPQRLLRQMIKHGIDRLLAPPSICKRLVESGRPLPLRWIATGGGPVFPDLLRRMQVAAPAAEIVCVYGSTEAEPIAHLAVSELDAADWEMIETGGGLPAGRPVSQIQLRIEAGEILVTGEHVNKGYVDPAGNLRCKRWIDGAIWHATGDAGRLDADGRLWLLGRLDGRVGELFPFSVETAALSWQGVRQAALVGIDGQPVLAIAGDALHVPSWRQHAAVAFPELVLHVIDRIPLDRRHNAKVDYPALRARLTPRRKE